MGNGWHEWPLMVFTVFGQCVVGGFIVLALALMTGKLSREQEQRVVGSMFGLWVLMGIGFIASTMHLGSPLRAFNSLNRVGASSLSNEIASGAIFFAVGGIGWLLAVCKKLPAGLRSLWLVVTMVLGVIFVWMMVRVYNTIDTVPTWYTVWTPLSFFLTLFIGGPLLGYLLLRVAGVDGWALRLLPVVSLLALLVSIMVVVMQGSELATIRSSVQQASALVPDYGLLMAWRMVLLALALSTLLNVLYFLYTTLLLWVPEAGEKRDRRLKWAAVPGLVFAALNIAVGLRSYGLMDLFRQGMDLFCQ